MQATGSHEKVNTNNVLTCLNSTSTMSKNLVSLFSILKHTLTSSDDFFSCLISIVIHLTSSKSKVVVIVTLRH